MKFISKISKQGEDYFIRIPRSKRDELKGLHEDKASIFVNLEGAF